MVALRIPSLLVEPFHCGFEEIRATIAKAFRPAQMNQG